MMPPQRFQTWFLEHTLLVHRLCDLLEAGNVGAYNQIITQPVLLSGLCGDLVDVLHHLVKLCVNFLRCPDQTLGVLCHLETGDADTASVDSLQRSNDHVLLLTQEIRSIVGRRHVGNFDVVLDAGLCDLFRGPHLDVVLHCSGHVDVDIGDAPALLTQNELAAELVSICLSVIETTPESSRLSELLPEIESISLDEVPFSVRARNALKRANVQTAGELVQMSEKDIMSLRNVAAQTRDEILAIIDVIIRDGRGYFDNLTSQDNQKLGDEPIVESAGKGFDFAVIDILTERFVFKPAKMTEWYGLSRQSVYTALEKRLPQRRSTWTGKAICESELSILAELIENKSFDYTDDEVTCCCMNNKQDDFVCLFIYENEIKSFFLNDLPDEIREQVVVKKMHMYTEREWAGESDGRVINVLTKPFYRPDNPERFRANAQLRGMTTDEYAVFFSGYPYLDQRSVTDEQIIAFMQENIVDGKIYISADPKNQWIRSIASRNGYTIKNFIELYGFESRLDGSELTTDGAKERHIEELRQYIVHDNVVHFPTDSRIYKIF